MGFRITGKKGFHITFKNGYTVSVQFGPANYCDNYNMPIDEEHDEIAGRLGSSEAEVAVWGKDGQMDKHPDFGGDTVKGYVNAEYVLSLLNWAASQKEDVR